MQLTLHIEQISFLTTVRSRTCCNGWRMACCQRTAERRLNTCVTSWLKAHRYCRSKSVDCGCRSQSQAYQKEFNDDRLDATMLSSVHRHLAAGAVSGGRDGLPHPVRGGARGAQGRGACAGRPGLPHQRFHSAGACSQHTVTGRSADIMAMHQCSRRLYCTDGARCICPLRY
jgi:hypothetical protein